MTTTEPETYTQGLGELIRAHRVYIGLSQREMARRLDKDRRDYQRIEIGRDACPPGMLSRITAMTDQFVADVDTVLTEADNFTAACGVPLTVEVDPDDEWNRLVAGRAAVETATSAPISLTLSGKSEERIA